MQPVSKNAFVARKKLIAKAMSFFQLNPTLSGGGTDLISLDATASNFIIYDVNYFTVSVSERFY